jgi:quinoprotein glucose dehydrogenase
MMPGFGQLSTAQRSALASFILDHKRSQAKLFTDTSIKLNNRYFNLPYTMSGISKFVSKEGFPGNAPPRGTLNAIDLNTGDFVWKKRLGHEPGFLSGTEQTGTESYGAPVTTAGGLVFIAATKDGMIRAFNKTNGQLLWETTLPAPGYATPAIYEVDGRQFIVIACGGGKMKTKSGDSYVAFALP